MRTDISRSDICGARFTTSIKSFIVDRVGKEDVFLTREKRQVWKRRSGRCRQIFINYSWRTDENATSLEHSLREARTCGRPEHNCGTAGGHKVLWQREAVQAGSYGWGRDSDITFTLCVLINSTRKNEFQEHTNTRRSSTRTLCPCIFGSSLFWSRNYFANDDCLWSLKQWLSKQRFIWYARKFRYIISYYKWKKHW